jgi:hypothetical protein
MQGRETSYTPPSSVEVMKDRSYSFTPSTCLYGTCREKFILCSDKLIHVLPRIILFPKVNYELLFFKY